MAYYATSPDALEGDPIPENRVWGFFADPNKSRLPNRLQSPQPRRRNRATTTKPVSGIPLWPSRDPIGEMGGINLYGFVGNDAVDYADYLGLTRERVRPDEVGPNFRVEGEDATSIKTEYEQVGDKCCAVDYEREEEAYGQIWTYTTYTESIEHHEWRSSIRSREATIYTMEFELTHIDEIRGLYNNPGAVVSAGALALLEKMSKSQWGVASSTWMAYIELYRNRLYSTLYEEIETLEEYRWTEPGVESVIAVTNYSYRIGEWEKVEGSEREVPLPCPESPDLSRVNNWASTTE